METFIKLLENNQITYNREHQDYEDGYIVIITIKDLKIYLGNLEPKYNGGFIVEVVSSKIKFHCNTLTIDNMKIIGTTNNEVVLIKQL